MDGKRSRGVTVFAWSIIILGAIGIPASGVFRDFTFLSPEGIRMLIAYSVVTSILSIVTGMNVLKLKEWARKLFMAIAFLGIVEVVIIYPLSSKAVNLQAEKDFSEDGQMYMQAAEQYDSFPEDSKVRNNFSREEYIQFTKKAVLNLSNVLGGAANVLGVLYSVFVIVFFRKKTVTAQFK